MKIDDPHEHFFTAFFPFDTGNSLVFPGATLGGIRPLKAIAQALLAVPEVYDPPFHQESTTLIRAVLDLSTLLIERAGLPPNAEPTGAHWQDAGRRPTSPLIQVPDEEVLLHLGNAATCEFHDLQSIEPAGRQALVRHLGRSWAEWTAVRSDDPEAIKRAPLLIDGTTWLVVAPHALVAATARKVLQLAQERGQSDVLTEQLRQAHLAHLRLALARLGVHRLPSDDPERPTWYALDADKVLHITTCLQDVASVQTEHLTGTWTFTLPDHPAAPPQQLGAPEVVHLVLVGDLGDGYRSLLPVAWRSQRPLVMRLDDLETLVAAHRNDSTMLWRLQRSWNTFRRVARVHADNPIDEIALLSGWDFPTHFPFSERGGVVLNGHVGADWKRRVHRDRHEHLVPWIDGRTLVPVERSPVAPPEVHLPLLPLWPHAHAVVEGPQALIWILEDRKAAPHSATRVNSTSGRPRRGTRGRQQGQDRLAGFLSSAVQGAAVWLSHLLPRLTPTRRTPGVITVRLTVTAGPAPCEVRVDRHRQTLWLQLGPTFIPLLEAPQNLADRMLVQQLYAGLTTLMTGRAPNARHIREVVNHVAPKGDMRLFMTHRSSIDARLDPRGLVPVRYVRPADVHEWAVFVGAQLAKPRRWTRGQAITATSQVMIDANRLLFEELQQRLSAYDGAALLPFLIAHLEAVVYETARMTSSLISRELAFGAYIKPMNPHSAETSVALRFLLELVAAQLPTGERPPSLTGLDDLMALAARLIAYGMAGDALRYGLGRIDVRLEADGALSVEALDYQRAQAELQTYAVRQAALEANEARYEQAKQPAPPQGAKENHPAPPTDDPRVAAMIDLCQAYFGVEPPELVRMINAALNLGDGQEGGVMAMPLPAFVEAVQMDSGLAAPTVELLLQKLSLCERGDYFQRPPDVSKSELFPWQFNRSMSLLKRPFIVTCTGELPMVVWGHRALETSKEYWLYDQLLGARLPSFQVGPAGQKKAAAAQQRLTQWRSDAFNASIAMTLRSRGIRILENVNRFGKLKLQQNGDALGDIDVLAIDEERRQLLILECKAYAPARTPQELHNQLEEFLVGKARRDGRRQRPLTERHLRRAQFVQEHLEAVLEFLQLPGDPPWRVRPAYVLSHLPNALFAHQAPLPVLDVDTLPAWLLDGAS